MFFVIGAQKAGTTMIHDWLKVEGCRLPRKKETHFFSHREIYKLGKQWYEEQFSGEGMQGEIDPEYLYSPTAPALIKEAYPDAKIIVLLREPIERAYSQYNMTVMRGFETQDFYCAINHEEERKKDINYTEHFSYIDRGIYVPQVKRVLKEFAEGQVLFIKFNTLFESDSREEEYKKLCAFIGFNSEGRALSFSRQANPASKPHSKLVSKLLWDKNSFVFLRGLVKIVFPAKKVRDYLARKIYFSNRKKIRKSAINYSMVSGEIRSAILSDLQQLQGITGLDLSDWVMRYPDGR